MTMVYGYRPLCGRKITASDLTLQALKTYINYPFFLRSGILFHEVKLIKAAMLVSWDRLDLTALTNDPQNL